MSDVEVNLEFTPNPDSLKYVANRPILANGARNFASLEEAKGQSELAEKIFELGDISGVMLGTNFVSVNFLDQTRLRELNQGIISNIKDFLESGKPVIHASQQKETEFKPSSDVEAKIVDILNKEIRPAVAMDGGDITFEKFEDGYVFLKMQGSCSGCPSSLMTLKMGVEKRLKDEIPEIQEVVPV